MTRFPFSRASSARFGAALLALALSHVSNARAAAQNDLCCVEYPAGRSPGWLTDQFVGDLSHGPRFISVDAEHRPSLEVEIERGTLRVVRGFTARAAMGDAPTRSPEGSCSATVTEASPDWCRSLAFAVADTRPSTCKRWARAVSSPPRGFAYILDTSFPSENWPGVQVDSAIDFTCPPGEKRFGCGHTPAQPTHGARVASIIGHEVVGVAPGVPLAQVVVLGPDGDGDGVWVVHGIRHVVEDISARYKDDDRFPVVVNLSLSMTATNPSDQALLAACLANEVAPLTRRVGTTVVAASGESSQTLPAGISGVLPVQALSTFHGSWYFTSAILAEDRYHLTACAGARGGYQATGAFGSSFAAAIASGALLQCAGEGRSAADAIEAWQLGRHPWATDNYRKPVQRGVSTRPCRPH